MGTSFSEVFSNSGFTLKQLNESLNPKFNRSMVFKAGEGAGRSGSFFFFSHDNRFIIKTLTNYELKLFLRILPSYLNHLKENPKGLLAKIYGLFTIKTNKIHEVNIILM